MTASIFTEQYGRFRELLVQYRQARAITQVQLAEVLKRPQSFVSKYESGERRLDLVEFLEISTALQFDPCESIRIILSEILPEPTIMDEWKVKQVKVPTLQKLYWSENYHFLMKTRKYEWFFLACTCFFNLLTEGLFVLITMNKSFE